jgi:hypothetical protein
MGRSGGSCSLPSVQFMGGSSHEMGFSNGSGGPHGEIGGRKIEGGSNVIGRRREAESQGLSEALTFSEEEC